jgi:hypothetical protein
MYTRRTLALASLASPALFCSQVRAESANAVTSTQPGADRTPLDINQLLLIENIKRLRVLYAHYLDLNDMEAIANLFSPDAVCDVGLGVWRGRKEIREGLAAAFADYDKQHQGSYPFMHAMANQWVVLTGPDSAQGRCYLLDWATQRKQEESPLLLLATYADEYTRIEGIWYISRTRLDIVWPKRNVGGGQPGKDIVLPN